MKKIKFVLCSLFFLTLSFCLRAQDVSGGWFINCGGTTFSLKINQTGNTFTGTMKRINTTGTDSIIQGKIEGKKVVFNRLYDGKNQEYEGYLFKNSGSGSKTMAGVFYSARSRSKSGWYATTQ